MTQPLLLACTLVLYVSSSALHEGEPDASDPAFRSPSLDLVEEVVKKDPLLKSQPLWNLISPQALHAPGVIDTPLRDLDAALEPSGQQLQAHFPNLRLRDLPVFAMLPKDLPRQRWGSTLEELSVSKSGPPEDALPFHVRNTPLQALRLEDLVLVGRRERVLRYRQAVEGWREKARESDFDGVKTDKSKAISQLEKKSLSLQDAYRRLHDDYSVERAETMEVKIRSDQDKSLIERQQAVLDIQQDKEKQLQSINSELAMKVREKEEKLQEGNGREQKMQTVVSLKHHAELLLRQQLQSFRSKADGNRRAEAASEGKAEQTLAVVMKRVRASSFTNKALLTKVEGTKAAIQAELEDKKRLEVGNAALMEQNGKLEKQSEQAEQLQSEADAQRATLQREVNEGRSEHDRLQREVDELEGARQPKSLLAEQILEDVDF